MTIQMKVDLREVRKLKKDINLLVKNFPELAEKVRRKLAHRTKALAKFYVLPSWTGSTGKLKRSIIIKKEGATSTDVIAGAPYAGYVEEGAKKHPMKFKPGSRGDFLSQFWSTQTGKKWHVAGSVRTHPGTKPMQFMEKGFRQMLKESEGLMQEEVNKYFSRRGF